MCKFQIYQDLAIILMTQEFTMYLDDINSRPKWDSKKLGYWQPFYSDIVLNKALADIPMAVGSVMQILDTCRVSSYMFIIFDFSFDK